MHAINADLQDVTNAMPAVVTVLRVRDQNHCSNQQ
jgi:hypothetical protein